MTKEEKPDRALVDKWLDLTRRQLPAAAGRHGWPIRLDHCFMRVCLDVACGRPWHEIVEKPAIRHAPAAMLARAVQVAEDVLAHPDRLAGLNEESLRLRRKSRPAR